MAVRQGRPGRYVVEFQTRGQRVFERLPPGVTKAQAQERETQLRRQIFDGVLGRREITIAEAIGTWLLAGRRKNPRQAESEARQWEPWAGRLLREAPEVAGEAVRTWGSASKTPLPAKQGTFAARLDALTCAPDGRARKQNGWPAGSGGSRLTDSPSGIALSTDAKTRQAVRRSHAVSPATINRRLALLKACLKHAWKQGLIPENLSGRITLLREDNKREVYLTREQVRRLADAAPTRGAQTAIMLLAYTGLRVSELLAMTPSNMHKASLTVRGKGYKTRVVPVPGPVRGLLSALPLACSYWQLRKEFLVACKRAGMKGVRIHDLRHTCASMLINQEVDLYTVGKILGHSGPATTARYAHLSTGTLEKAMSKLR